MRRTRVRSRWGRAGRWMAAIAVVAVAVVLVSGPGLTDQVAGLVRAIAVRYGAAWVALAGVVLLGLGPDPAAGTATPP